MKYILLLILLFSSSQLFAKTNDKDEQLRKEKNIQEQMKKEEKYAQEKTFYSGNDYDLKSAEVNMESVKNLPDVENTYEGYDMTHDYD